MYQCFTEDFNIFPFLNNTGRKHWDSGLVNCRDINTSRAQSGGRSPATSGWAWETSTGATEADWTGDPGASNEERSFTQEAAARTTAPSSAATAAYPSLAIEARRWRDSPFQWGEKFFCVLLSCTLVHLEFIVSSSSHVLLLCLTAIVKWGTKI